MSHTRLYTHNHIDESIITYTHGLERIIIPLSLDFRLYNCICILRSLLISAFIVYLGGHVLMIYLSFLVLKNSFSCCFIVLVRPLVLFRRRC